MVGKSLGQPPHCSFLPFHYYSQPPHNHNRVATVGAGCWAAERRVYELGRGGKPSPHAITINRLVVTSWTTSWVGREETVVWCVRVGWVDWSDLTLTFFAAAWLGDGMGRLTTRERELRVDCLERKEGRFFCFLKIKMSSHSHSHSRPSVCLGQATDHHDYGSQRRQLHLVGCS